MAIRCLLFCGDEDAAAPIRAVLTALGVEGEFHSDGMTAADRISSAPFQIVILDWDQQPDASSLLRTARERKASERPLTLAIVGEDASVPKALQAGANSILRKPLLVNQVHDTLATARDLIESKSNPATGPSVALSGTPAAAEMASLQQETTLRAGEFLQSSASATQFDTESDMQKSLVESAAKSVDPLKDLEPMAAAVAQSPAADEATPVPQEDEPRGLEFYMKARGVTRSQQGRAPEAHSGPELVGFDQSGSAAAAAPAPALEPAKKAEAIPEPVPETSSHEQQEEAKLFRYISGEKEEHEASVGGEEKPRREFRLGRGTIVFAGLLAACAIAAAPQAPWHSGLRALVGRGQHALHAWLNPQPVTTPAAPDSHESFGRPGDEYKLPVAENIPDATTDPSQIQVTPVIDPTAKKNASDPTAIPDGSTGTPDGTQTPAVQVQENPATETSPAQLIPNSESPANPAPETKAPENAAPQPVQNQPAPVVPVKPPAITAPQSLQQPMQPGNAVATTPSLVATTQPAVEKVPSSLQSQGGSMRPDIGGDKAPATALDSIEPVSVSEASERALLANQPAVAYPASAKGQTGTVLLQVLIGRDGAVQDAKFLQGSLAFARAAIDGVKQWKFKPYIMNERPTSVQTTLTLSFKPAP